MNLMRRPRAVFAIAVVFITVAVLYAGLAVPLGYHIEWAGATMLAALGVAMSILFYVLINGLQD